MGREAKILKNVQNEAERSLHVIAVEVRQSHEQSALKPRDDIVKVVQAWLQKVWVRVGSLWQSKHRPTLNAAEFGDTNP